MKNLALARKLVALADKLALAEQPPPLPKKAAPPPAAPAPAAPSCCTEATIAACRTGQATYG